MSRKTVLVSVLSAALLAPALAFAQEQPAGSPPPPSSSQNDHGNRGNHHWNPQEMRQRLENHIKDQLKVTDDQWKVIQPKLQKVFEARRDTMGGMFFRRNRRGENQNQPQSAVQKASRDLRQTLDNNNASAEEIANKLHALRDAKEKAKANLVSAEKDLTDVLTQRQEAVLVVMGILD